MSEACPPTPEGFLVFIRTVMGIPADVLPTNAPVICQSYNLARQIVNPLLQIVTGPAMGSCDLSPTAFPSKPVIQPNYGMMPEDGEVVMMSASPCAVFLPSGVPFGHLCRVSDGTGTNRRISVSAPSNGTINGAFGALAMDFAWNTTQFRCLGGNQWSIV